MKILVTGGAGFIGSEFVRQSVLRRFDTTVVDNLSYAGDMERLKEVEKDIRFYREDIRNRDAMNEIFKKERPDVVVHFAAESHVDRSILEPNIFIETNIIGIMNLLEVSRNYKVERFINISTDEVYGELSKDGYFTEESPLRPNSPYSVSKASQDMLGRAYWRTYGIPVITVRPSNNYGYWQYPEKLIPLVIAKAINGEEIPVYGTGENIREWLHVSDCVKGIMAVIERGKIGEIYNIGSAEERRNIDVVSTILRILNKPLELIRFIPDRPGHDFRYSLDSTKIKKELGWSPEIRFEEGLEMTVRWYMEHTEYLNQKIISLRKYWKRVYKE